MQLEEPTQHSETGEITVEQYADNAMLHPIILSSAHLNDYELKDLYRIIEQ